MFRQSGVATTAVVAVLAVVAVAGAGFFAWQKMAEADKMRDELSAVKKEYDKSRFEASKAAQQSATAAKQTVDMKVAIDRLTAERDAVRTTLENQQAAGVQLRAELDLAKQQVSYLGARVSKDVIRGMPTKLR